MLRNKHTLRAVSNGSMNHTLRIPVTSGYLILWSPRVHIMLCFSQQDHSSVPFQEHNWQSASLPGDHSQPRYQWQYGNLSYLLGNSDIPNHRTGRSQTGPVNPTAPSTVKSANLETTSLPMLALIFLQSVADIIYMSAMPVPGLTGL